MRKFLCFILVIAFSAVSAITQEDDLFTLHQDLIYSKGDGWELGLDIAVPQEGGPHPLVVYYYGSGFRKGNRKNLQSVLIPMFISRGYAIGFVTYRAVPEFQFPAPVHDAKNSIRFIRANADKFNIDPGRILAYGFSSGGYLALMLGLTGPGDGLEGETEYPEVSSSVTAVICHAGPTDFRLKAWHGVHLLLMGGSIHETPEIWEKADATNYAGDEEDAPVLYITNGRDRIIGKEHGIELDKASHRTGKNTLVYKAMLKHDNTFPDVIWWFIDAHIGR